MQLYGRQLAWLQQPIDAKNAASSTRAEMRGRRDMPLGLPKVEAQHLLQMLDQMGWAESGGFGPVPLSAREILAWCDGMAVELEPWEFELIRAASRAYCRQAAAKDPREPTFDAEAAGRKPGGLAASLAATLNRKPERTP